ncbi:virulence RhuM family protein [Hydrogenimonas thermophila]|uniref:virulence RhuM family protein n=1 Tax=Hydrogenimonas thermophila TaxID=223786 RepID=UPI0029371FBE|nr:virulence RhuM family protein [Hydrogenimonas thermophila]WOE71127.1 virulence RhuM family protein [Hydrogenimonas thermophila]WOE73644.1 virulence RhuM family protein [Hydrogenimonas thermophila]
MTQNFIIYTDQNENVNLKVFIKDETIWATQKQMAELFGVDRSVISKHLKNVFETEELDEKVVCANFALTTKHGAIEGKTQTKQVKYYNLDAIIAVGYRVNSKRATQFRIWATKVLREFIIKGFVLDDERLKQGKYFEKDYFDELLERVRSIRASERRIYQKITDIFAECSIDYDPKSEITRNFYANIQNKFHYAITGKTAAEIIYEKADKSKPNMGLTTWKNSPKGRILKSDVEVAKNYLSQKEIKELEKTVSSFFDYIERLIEKRETFTMEEFAKAVDKFLEFNEYEILDGFGKISHQKALQKAHKEYEEFNRHQPIESDFDKFIKQLKD